MRGQINPVQNELEAPNDPSISPSFIFSGARHNMGHQDLVYAKLLTWNFLALEDRGPWEVAVSAGWYCNPALQPSV